MSANMHVKFVHGTAREVLSFVKTKPIRCHVPTWLVTRPVKAFVSPSLSMDTKIFHPGNLNECLLVIRIDGERLNAAHIHTDRIG